MLNRTTMQLEDIYCELANAVLSDDGAVVRQIVESLRSSSMYNLQQLLHVAISKDDLTVVQHLLRYKIDIIHEDEDGHRTIHVAAQYGNSQIIKAVISAGSPINIVNGQGIGALHMCLENSHDEAAMMLISEGATVNRPRRYDSGEAPMHVAAKLGMNDVLQRMICKGGDVNLLSGDRSTPLFLAVREKHPLTVRLLCDAGSSVNACNFQGRTPFHLAAQQVSVEMVRILLPYIDNINVSGRGGLTALHYVTCAYPPTYSQSEIVNLLIAYGADVRQRDNDGKTALHMVAYTGDVNLAQVLIANGAELNLTENVIGETPLNTAAAHDRYEMIKLLVEKGADVNIGDKGNQTPLHKIQAVKASRSKYRSTEILLQYGARVNEAGQRGVTPFEQCIFRSIMNRECRESLNILRRLVAAGARLRPCFGQRSLQNSPLCWLTWHNELEAAAFLVNAGWDLNEEKWINLPGKNPAMEQFLVRLRQLTREPLSLACVCRRVIRKHAIEVCDDRDIVPCIEQLPIPLALKKFITFENEDDVL